MVDWREIGDWKLENGDWEFSLFVAREFLRVKNFYRVINTHIRLILASTILTSPFKKRSKSCNHFLHSLFNQNNHKPLGSAQDVAQTFLSVKNLIIVSNTHIRSILALTIKTSLFKRGSNLATTYSIVSPIKTSIYL